MTTWIWYDGRVVPDETLTVSVRDRTFEHGLGLFETLRTWNGHAPLLDRHVRRMINSARCLGIPTESVPFPDRQAVGALLLANRLETDVVLRITLTGGVDKVQGATLWMRTGPLPPPVRSEGAVVTLGSGSLRLGGPIDPHKTLNYWSRRLASEYASTLGADEILGIDDVGRIWEGSRTNIFAVQGSTLLTPVRDGPIVPGVMRGLVLDLARSLPIAVQETCGLALEHLQNSDEVFLTNSVRGVIPVARLDDTTWPAPGERTRQLAGMIEDWIAKASLGEIAP